MAKELSKKITMSKAQCNETNSDELEKACKALESADELMKYLLG